MKRIALLAGMVVFSICSIQSAAQEKLTNEKIWNSQEFSVKSISGVNSMKDGITYTRLDNEDKVSLINKYDYKTNKKLNTIAKSSDFKHNGKDVGVQAYQFNADETKLLIGDQLEGIYRHSSKGNYFVWDITKKSLTPIADFSKGKQSVPEFSPDGSKVAFMRENNLFVYDLVSGKETTITTDGKWNHIINGMCDWVYEEEFGFDKAWQWNSNGTRLAFYRFDESEVREFQMAMYGELYPKQYSFKYPKAGEKNSVVSINVYDLATQKVKILNTGEEKDQYIPRIKWTNDPGILCVMRMNRLQNKLELLNYEVTTISNGKPVYTEENNTYVDVNDDLHFMADNSFFLSTEKDGFNHIYHFSNNGKLLGQVTKGKWDVTSLYGIDEANKVIYYQSAENDPTRRDVYSIKFDGSAKTRLTPNNGSNSANFSRNFKYFINYYSAANTPPVVTLNDNKGKLISVLEDNAKLVTTLKKYELPAKEFLSFKTANGVFNAWMIKPVNFDPTKKYPVFMTVYQGPGSNTVNDAWDSKNLLWHSLLAQNGYIVVSVDGRGTGYRGADFKKVTYKQLGKYETEDQIASAKYLAGLPYVDGGRIGIQGWSYGGYMTLLCMTKGADVFKMGISVAPVTTWKFYDSIYTERYLQTPQDNASGYDDNSPLNFADKLKGKLLLVHGSADDNVHYQNSMEMVSSLVKANKDFDLMIYPNKNHSIYGGNTRLHLYNKMTNYVLNNL
ncbi:MAG: S9 family peptidase [Bacteroidota bacterium]